MSTGYDTVVIGSGIGGLTCGAFCARAGMHVLVLEQHSKIGGYAHGFKRKDFAFESGIHSVSLAPHGLIAHLLRLLDVGSMVDIVPHEAMYAYRTPSCGFRIPQTAAEIPVALTDAFPYEKDGIGRLLADMERIYEAIVRPAFDFERVYKEESRECVAAWAGRSYADYIGSFITDPRLRGVFHAMWPYGGSSPESAPMLFYAMMFAVHFREGSHHIKGGFGTLAAALAQAITRNDGSVRTRACVEGLIVENGAVRAVRLADGEVIEARTFVSNISPYALHRTLIPGPARSKLWLRRLSALKPSFSCIGVYLGLSADITQALDAAINFDYSTDDHTALFQNIMENRLDAQDHLIYLAGEGPTGKPTLTLMRFAKIDGSADWKRDKLPLAESMVAAAEKRIPGLRDAIAVMEIGSPATFERYTGNTNGALYGFENTKEIYGEAKVPITTYLRNLFQVGHWGRPGGGVWNVMYNGYTASKIIERTKA